MGDLGKHEVDPKRLQHGHDAIQCHVKSAMICRDVFLEFLDVIYACLIHLILSVASFRILRCSFQINAPVSPSGPAYCFDP